MQPAWNLPGRLSQSPGAIDRRNDRHTGQNSCRIHLEQGFEGTRLNTGTMSRPSDPCRPPAGELPHRPNTADVASVHVPISSPALVRRWPRRAVMRSECSMTSAIGSAAS